MISDEQGLLEIPLLKWKLIPFNGTSCTSVTRKCTAERSSGSFQVHERGGGIEHTFIPASLLEALLAYVYASEKLT